jgi:hypothetical protein
MNVTLENYQKETFEVSLNFSHEFTGYGKWNIICESSFKNNCKKFKLHITDSQIIDEINDLKSDGSSFEEIQNFYKELYFQYFEPIILDFCEYGV